MDSLHLRSVEEIERRAFCEHDQTVTDLITKMEDEAYNAVTPDHEAVIDDRNRLAEALKECVDRMNDVVTQIDECDIFTLAQIQSVCEVGQFEVLSKALENLPMTEPSEAFKDAIELAQEALKEVEPQEADTLRDRCRTLEASVETMRREAAVRDEQLEIYQRIYHTAERLVRPYTSKAPPKWAADLIRSMKP